MGEVLHQLEPGEFDEEVLCELEPGESDGEVLRHQVIILENYHNIHLKLWNEKTKEHLIWCKKTWIKPESWRG